MYRGMSLGADDYKELMIRVVEKGTVVLQAPQGFSRNNSTAEKFSGGPQRIIFVVDKAKTARMIEHVGGYGGEAEMIAMPMTQYKVKGYEEVKSGGYEVSTYIYMTEK